MKSASSLAQGIAMTSGADGTSASTGRMGEIPPEGAVGGAADVDFGRSAGLPGIAGPDRLGELLGAIGRDQVDRAAGPSGPRELAPQETGRGLRRPDHRVERRRAVLEVAPAG